MMNHKLDTKEFESLSLLNKAQGQMMTILPFLTGPLLHRFPKIKENYHFHCLDPVQGQVPIFGELYSYYSNRVLDVKDTDQSTCKKLRIILHGISSVPSSPYLAPYVHAGIQSGHDVLCLALRGALGKGHDHYHAGLTDDIFAVLQDPRLAHYEELSIVGCSLGGLLALNVARRFENSKELSLNLTSVAAICPPLSMRQAQLHLDQTKQAIYRKVVLSSLKQAYRKLWQEAQKANKPFVSDLKAVMKVKTFAEWDREVVLPRFGFSSIEDYYQKVSISVEDLAQLKTQSLLIFDRADPMIPIANMGFTDQKCKKYGQSTVYITRGGGHIGFPFNFDLGLGKRKGIAQQVESWLTQ